MKKISSDICPHCRSKLPAHKGNTKTFKQLTAQEREKSIRMMAINLKRAINADSASVRCKRILWAIQHLAK